MTDRDSDGAVLPASSDGPGSVLGEGRTPVFDLPGVAAELGLRAVYAKCEHLNPTGSYKDRIAATSIRAALAAGNPAWIATSSGNAGASLAAYGAAVGLPGAICVTDTAPEEKLLGMLAYGVHVVRITGTGTAGTSSAGTTLFATVRRLAERHNLYLAVTAHAFNEAGMRAADDITRELAAQRPDTTHVYVPTGGGGLVAACARGLTTAGSSAAVVAVQPTGCAPIVRHLDGELALPRVDACTSGISALQLPNPPDGALAAGLIRTTGGYGVAVDDATILAAHKELRTAHGVFVEPASAAAFAALRADVARGRMTRDAAPTLVLTGHGLKDLRPVHPGRFSSPVTLRNLRASLDTWAHEVAGRQART